MLSQVGITIIEATATATTTNTTEEAAAAQQLKSTKRESLYRTLTAPF